MSGEVPAAAKWNVWVVCAFGALAAALVGFKCLCPDPDAELRKQVTGVADVRGTPLRVAAPVETPAPAPAPAALPTLVVEKSPKPAPAAEPAVPPVAAPPTTREPVAAPPPPAAAAAPETPKTEPVAAKKPEGKPDDGKPRPLTWDEISQYKYVPPKPDEDVAAAAAPTKETTDQIPADVRAMSGKRYVIEGYGVPLDFEKGVVTKFILLPAPLACCFAEAPPMNRWMMVENKGKSEWDDGKYNLLRVTGAFEVGEDTREGYVVGIYRMRAEKVENVKDE